MFSPTESLIIFFNILFISIKKGDEEEFDEDLEDDDFDEEEDLRLMEHELVMKMTSFLSGEPHHHPMSFKMNNQSKEDSNNVVVRKLDDLLPAFDPRPGRLNLQQTVDFNIPSPGWFLTEKLLFLKYD